MQTTRCTRSPGMTLAVMRMLKGSIAFVVFASMFVVGAVPNAQARQCSNASLKGAYGFLDSHTVVPAGTPVAALGRWNFDGKGNFTNTVTFNDHSTVTHINDFGPNWHTRRHGNHRDRARGRG